MDEWEKVVQHMIASEAARWGEDRSTEAVSDFWVCVLRAAIEATDTDRERVLRAVALEIVGED